MPDPSEAKKDKLPWWVTALIGSAGAFVPQLCSLIPQAAGSFLCKFVLMIAINTFGTGVPPIRTDLPQPQPPAVECPAERRASNGYCLPP